MTNNGYTKEITLEDNFLDKCGYTVREIIEYLSKFPDDAEICVSIDGDTHGCKLESTITHRVSMNDKEILRDRVERVQKRIIDCKASIDYYTIRGQHNRIKETNLLDKLADYEKQLSELLK